MSELKSGGGEGLVGGDWSARRVEMGVARTTASVMGTDGMFWEDRTLDL